MESLPPFTANLTDINRMPFNTMRKIMTLTLLIKMMMPLKHIKAWIFHQSITVMPSTEGTLDLTGDPIEVGVILPIEGTLPFKMAGEDLTTTLQIPNSGVATEINPMATDTSLP